VAYCDIIHTDNYIDMPVLLRAGDEFVTCILVLIRPIMRHVHFPQTFIIGTPVAYVGAVQLVRADANIEGRICLYLLHVVVSENWFVMKEIKLELYVYQKEKHVRKKRME
jgi:hypothetical protein